MILTLRLLLVLISAINLIITGKKREYDFQIILISLAIGLADVFGEFTFAS